MVTQVVPGGRFSRLEVVREGPRVPNGAKTARGIVVRCDCGSNEFVVNINNLRSGRTTSCGCAKREACIATRTAQYGKTRVEIQNGRQANLTGKVFGRLTAVEDLGCKNGQRLYRCLCTCGKEKAVKANSLIHEKGARSCGCLQREVVTKHGLADTRIYQTWRDMLARCYNPQVDSYSNYGGRGITVCEQWREDVRNFLADMGEPPTPLHTLDRCNPFGNYEPGNCRWATIVEQANNRRTNVVLIHDGKEMTLTQWSQELGINPSTIRHRLRLGWTVGRALSEPVNNRN